MNYLMFKILFWLSAGCILYTYFLYPNIIFIISRLWSRPIIKEELSHKVSLVVSVYNEQSVIKDKIINCLSIDYPIDKLEIIIGSDGSTDKTNQIISSNLESRIKFESFKDRRGKVNVLNDLIGLSTGDIVVLSDANTIFETNAVKELLKYFSDQKVGCVCGKLVLKKSPDGHNSEFEGLYWKYETYLKSLEGKIGVLLGANGGIYAIRKELFQPLPSNIIIDDFVIPLRILQNGYKVIYAPTAIAYEESEQNIAKESIRKIRIGAGNYQALFLTLPMLNILKGIPSFAYWSHKVLRWLVPFFMIIAFFSNFLLINILSFKYVFIAQILFYMLAIVGYVTDKSKVKFNKIFAVFYYFFMMNLSLFLGFVRFLTNKQKVTWGKNR